MRIILIISLMLSLLTVYGQKKIEYYAGGSIKCSYFMKDGEKHGKSIEYYRNGQIKIKGKYRKGKKVGHWKSYSESGLLLGEIWFSRKGKWKKNKIIEPAYKKKE